MTDEYEYKSLLKDLGVVTGWPYQVELKLRSIFLLVRERKPLSREDCKDLVTYFVYPNLVHWILHMRVTDKASPYAERCPLHAGPVDCMGRDDRTWNDRFISVPRRIAQQDGSDFCRLREAKHPWSLQVSLLGNIHEADSRSYPSQACAWEAYRNIADCDDVLCEWTDADIGKREKRTHPRWNKIADAIRSTQGGSVYASDPSKRVLKGIDPSLLLDLCEVVNDLVLQLQIMRSGKARNLRDHWEDIVSPLERDLGLYVELGRPYPCEKERDKIDSYLSLLEDLDAPGITEIRNLLTQKEIQTLDVRRVYRHLTWEVLPTLQSGVSPPFNIDGDPLDDPLVQDLFWDRVGSRTRSGRSSVDPPSPFNLKYWCYERWHPVETDPLPNGRRQYVPKWRTQSP